MSDEWGGSTLSLCNDFGKLIPARITDGYTLDEAYITTYSLTMSKLTELVYSIDALPLVPGGRLKIFYDAYGRTAENAVPPVYEQRLCAVKPANGKAFHPKVMLLKYTKGGAVRFVFASASKNISPSELIDAYSVSYGDCTGAPQESGQRAAAFFERFGNADALPEDTKRLLSQTAFAFDRGNKQIPVRFLTGGEAWQILRQIQHGNELIVVSPFLSDNFYERFSGARFFSTEEGFAALDLERRFSAAKAEAPDDEKKAEEKRNFLRSCRLINNLHAKIYCWKDGEGTNFIIGSSNATNNGLCMNGDENGNIEFNAAFRIEADAYGRFLALLESRDVSREVNIPELIALKTTADLLPFDPRKTFADFVRGTVISCSAEDNENGGKIYKCTVTADGFTPDKQTAVAVGPGRSTELPFELAAPEPFLSLSVAVSQPGKNIREFCLPLYDYWDEDTRKILDVREKEAYCGLLRAIIDNPKKGGRSGGGLPRIYAGNSPRTLSEEGSRTHFYEELLSLSRDLGENELETALREKIRFADIIAAESENAEERAYYAAYRDYIAALMKGARK